MDNLISDRYIKLIGHLKNTMSSDGFLQRNRQNDQDFTRKRCLPFLTVVLLLLNMLKHALQDELDEFFRLVQNEPVAQRVVTKSAFSQARQKLKYSAFVELNQAQVAFFYDQFEPLTWQNKRLLAIDGSMATLPNVEAVATHFGVWHPHAGGRCPKARLSQLFDVLNKVTIEATIAPKEKGERALAAQHCNQIGAGDVLLLDRGYPAFWLFTLIHSKQADFCARVTVATWSAATKFVKSGKQEATVTLKPSAESIKQCRKLGLSTEPLTVRLLRVELPSGEIEVLMSSLLDNQAFPYELFKELYHHRWPVEEDYKCLKSRFEIENWSGQTVAAVYQDFHANVFTKNLASLLSQPAQLHVSQQTQSRKHRYQINMTNLVSKMKDSVVHLFVMLNPLPVIQGLWQQMTGTIEPIRPNRTYERNKRVKPKRHRMNYKSTR